MAGHKQENKKSWIAALLLYLIGAILLVAAFILVVRMKNGKAQQIASSLRAQRAAAQAGPRVQVTTVQESPATQTLTLLGETHAFLESTLYAKVSGYLKTIYVDKGDTARANQVLGVIESPETDAQYQAAVINARNLEEIAARDENLVKRDMIAQQDAATAVANARVAAQDVQNLATLKSYEIIRAPFDGKITARYADPGALVQSAQTSQTAALPLVRISEISEERVYIYPDQRNAAFIHVGDRVAVSDPAKPGVKIAARVTRISGEFDTDTRTMLVEIDFSNYGNRIPPGSFVEVTLRLRSRSRYLEIPAAALVLRGTKTFAAVVGSDNRITFQPVDVASDDGTRVSVRSGLASGDRIAINIGENVPDGSEIQPVSQSSP
ncbi:MAG: efflux RND transporter periplasmic adaptor subunit [Terriglobia bacterium]